MHFVDVDQGVGEVGRNASLATCEYVFKGDTVIQFAPGGPVEQVLAELKGNASDATSAFSGQGGDVQGSGQSAGNLQAGNNSQYRGAQGLDPAIIEEIEKRHPGRHLSLVRRDNRRTPDLIAFGLSMKRGPFKRCGLARHTFTTEAGRELCF